MVFGTSSFDAGVSSCSSAGTSGWGMVSFCSSALALSSISAAAISSTSRLSISLPVVTWSPRFTAILLTTPDIGAGISIAALSLSRTKRESFSSTLWPTETRSSITSTSVASPKSGTVMFSIAKKYALYHFNLFRNY